MSSYDNEDGYYDDDYEASAPIAYSNSQAPIVYVDRRPPPDVNITAGAVVAAGAIALTFYLLTRR